MTRPPPQQKNRSVVSANLCFLSLLAVVGCSTETDKTANHLQYSETELLLKDGNVIDTRQYWRDGNTKIVNSSFRILPPSEDKYEWFYIYLDAGCKFASFLEETWTETTQSPTNDSTSKDPTGEVEIHSNAKRLIRLVSHSSLDFNPTSESIGSFDSVFKCAPLTSRSVSCDFVPKNSEPMSQIPYHNRAKDYIVEKFGAFQSFTYIRSALQADTAEGTDKEKFFQSIETISFDLERMTCDKKMVAHASE